MTYKPEIAIIMRSDEVLEIYKFTRCTVNTSFGPVDRCYFGRISNIEVMIVYGRFNGQKLPSDQINYQQTMEAIYNMGVRKVIGTFVVGGIKRSSSVGDVYIVKDIVGMGNYHIMVNQKDSFHNAEMYNPVCGELTSQLERAAQNMPYTVVTDAVYVCFHGWPRIETKAELAFYEKMGWDIVGQTIDPEATIARLYGMCYAAIAVQIDDPNYRENEIKKIQDGKKSENSMNITQCRKRTTEMILEFLKTSNKDTCTSCQNISRKNTSFREFPAWCYE